MKLLDKTTAHILVKANNNSEWDNCEFAIKGDFGKSAYVLALYFRAYTIFSLWYYNIVFCQDINSRSDNMIKDLLLTLTGRYSQQQLM